MMEVSPTVFLTRQTPSGSVSDGADSKGVSDSPEKTSEFGKLLGGKQKTDPAEPGAQTAPKGRTAQQAGETEEEKTPSDAAAVLAAMSLLSVPVQIQTQEALPRETGQTEIGAAVRTGIPSAVAETPTPLLQSEPLTQPAAQPGAEQKPAAQTAADRPAFAGDGVSAAVQTAPQPSRPESAGQREGEGSGKDRQDEQAPIQPGDAAVSRPLFRPMETVPVKVGEAPATEAASPELDTQLADALGKALDDGAQHVKIQLTPENLGTVTIDLTRDSDGSLRVVLHPSTDKAAELLTQHSAALTSLLQTDSQADVQVRVLQHREEALYFQQQNQEQQGRGQSGQQERRQRRESEDFLQQLRLGLIPAAGQAV